MWGQLNSLTKQFAEQASQAVKDVGIDKRLENVSQQMVGGLDKLANSVLTVEEVDANHPGSIAQQSEARPRGLMALETDSHDGQDAVHVAKKKGKMKKFQGKDILEENELLKQRLAGVEAAAADALGELEEYKERLEKANQRKTSSEQDLQKAKREISKLKKQVKSAQTEIMVRTSESEKLKEDVALLRQSGPRDGSFEVESQAQGSAAEMQHPANADMAAEVEKLGATLREKDAELFAIKSEIKARDEELGVGRLLVESLRGEISELKTAQEVQQQQAKRQEIELGNMSRKLSSCHSTLEEKQVELNGVVESMGALLSGLQGLQKESERAASKCVSLSKQLKGSEKALSEKSVEVAGLLIGIEGITEIVASMDESSTSGSLSESFAELKEALGKIRPFDSDASSPIKTSTGLEQAIRNAQHESARLTSVVGALRIEVQEAANLGDENERRKLMTAVEELACLHCASSSKPSAEAVNLQIVVREESAEKVLRENDAAIDALNSKLRKSESTNQALEAELRSCQEEIDKLLENSTQLEAIIDSKATEHAALREGARAESNLSIEKLRNAQAELAECQERAEELEEHVAELEASLSEWKSRAETRGGEMDAASGAIAGLQKEVTRLTGMLEAEKATVFEKVSESARQTEQKMAELMESQVAGAREEELKSAQSREEQLRMELVVLEETVEKLQTELADANEVANQVGALEASKSDLEKELSDTRASLSAMQSALAEAKGELAALQQSLDAQLATAEDRKKKFVMLQTTFKTKEAGLLAEISELRAQAEMVGMQSAAAVDEHDLMESSVEFEKLQDEYEALQEKVQELERRCQELETELWERKEESSALTIKLASLESLNSDNDATISELRASEGRFKQLLAAAEDHSRESDGKVLELETELAEAKAKVEVEEGQLQAAELRVLEAEARAEAAERSKIKMSLAMADMDEQKASKEQHPSASGSQEDSSTSNPEVEALKSQLSLAEEQSKQLRWQVKMMTQANESDGKSNSTSWIFGCVSNRK